MKNIVELNDSKIVSFVLNRAFLAFAQECNFTKENAPNHLAFIDSDGVEAWLNNGLKMHGYIIDDKIIRRGGHSYYKDQLYLIERLATLPEYRNIGVENKIKNIGGNYVEIHFADKNTVTREWYKKQGCKEIKIEEANIPGIAVVPF